MPDCPSQPRPTSCSEQQDARIPIACLSLSPAGTSELQESQPICSSHSGVQGSGCGRAAPVLITREPAQPLPPAHLPSEHHLSCSVATISQVPCYRCSGVITLFKPQAFMQGTNQCPLFTDEETEAQGGDMISPGSHSLLVAEMD